MSDIKERILACFNESIEESVGNIQMEFSVHELSKVLEVLIHAYKERPLLLQKFWQSASDACPLEESEYENQIIEFKKFVNEIS